MAILGDALRQAFMPKHEYDSLREEEKAWGRLRRPLVAALAAVICLAVLVAASVSMRIVFPGETGRRPFCHDRRIQGLSLRESDVRQFGGTFDLTDEEVADYYWMVVFIPSAIVFLASCVYLFAGVLVAYSAPVRHPCLKVVENNYCASKRGGVRCLSIINVIFAVVFGLLALLLGSNLLTLGSSCSIPLFWCYEIASWGLVFLYGGTAFFLRRKAAVILDQGDFAGRNLGVEMLEPIQDVTPDMERRVNEGFKAWMGSSLLSSDEEDGPDDYIEEGYLLRTNSDER
uniref:Pericentriolar material 1 protein n=1 Tax=Anthurium amnicola TaxID=1678845 RepID=A0A1D1XL49_9ARAE